MNWPGLSTAGRVAQQSGDASGDTTASPGCGKSDFVCQRVLEWTGNQQIADWVDFFVDTPLKILLIIVFALILNRLLRKGIKHSVNKVVGVTKQGQLAKTKMLVSEEAQERAEQRAETLSTVLRSVTTGIIFLFAFLIIMGQLGIDIGPLIAGAGIAGVALGFGAQSLVKDFLSGFFMLLEDQFGVGDIVDLGNPSTGSEIGGVVEKVTLRVTTLRDVYGTLWHVPNGEILRVGNKSQLWARALVDVGVAYGTDIDHAQAVIKGTADAMWQEEEWSDDIKEEPEIWGVEALAPDQVTIRLVLKTEPSHQWMVERELRGRIKKALDVAAIEIPFPQRTVWLRTTDSSTPDKPEIA